MAQNQPIPYLLNHLSQQVVWPLKIIVDPIFLLCFIIRLHIIALKVPLLAKNRAKMTKMQWLHISRMAYRRKLVENNCRTNISIMFCRFTTNKGTEGAFFGQKWGQNDQKCADCLSSERLIAKSWLTSQNNCRPNIKTQYLNYLL